MKLIKFIKDKRTIFRVLFILFMLLIMRKIVKFEFMERAPCSKESLTVIAPDEFEQVTKNNSIFLSSVHTPYMGEINGADLIIEDWKNVEKHLNQSPNNSMPIAIYCERYMSRVVGEKLKGKGYPVYDLQGGMNAWENSGG